MVQGDGAVEENIKVKQCVKKTKILIITLLFVTIQEVFILIPRGVQ
jgi:hypothetical protein